MLQRLPLFILCILLSTQVLAQPYTIKGKLSDTVNYNPLPNASVTLLRAADSVMENFTRTKEDGSFSLTVSKQGKYIMLTVFPGFADFVDKINIQNPVTDLGEVPMTSRTHLMEEFVFTERYSAIRVKGDTVEYLADSFSVKDNATVEELLKKLPGLQVDKDGNIQAHGQKVEKLLVDGEEFFTDDPAVVSKSLQAKAVDKVQVFDKKSEQAEFTGIDDGEVTRTVNLQLKEDMKKGYFGKVVGSGGTGVDQDYFENQAMFNYFKGKKKISAFGIMANTGKIGLGWEDRDKFGGGNNTSMGDDGSVTTYYTSDEFDSWNGQYNGQGFPKAWTGGVHFSDKWNEDKHRIATNYRYAKQNIESIDNTISQVILPDDQVQFTQQSEDKFKTGQRHKVDGLYEWKTDSLSTLRLTASGHHMNSLNKTKFNQNVLSTSGDTLSTSDRDVNNEATTKRIISNLTWRKKFNKDRRTLVLSMGEHYEESNSSGRLNTIVRNKISGKDSITDQRKENVSTALNVDGAATYTEPITKAMAVSLEYKLSINNTNSERNTFNKSAVNADVYDAIDPNFSNHYAYNIITHRAGTNFSWDYKKLDFSAGMNVANTAFNQEDLIQDTSFKYSVFNLFPKASLRYKIGKQTSIRFRYNGQTRQPTIQQIQPIQDNTNPQNITVGNANLTQEFRNSFNLNFNDYKVLSGRWIYIYSGFTITDNAITRAQTVDTVGNRRSQYVNIDGNYNGYAGGGIGKRITKYNASVGANFNTNISRNNNFVNNVKNVTNNNSYTVGVDADYETKNEKFEVGIDVSFTYNDNKSDINTQTTSYWSTNYGFDARYELPWKMEIGTDFNWYIREKTAVFDRNNNVFRWNAYLSKSFLENDQLELRASVYDILNQNLGFNRYAYGNSITESNYNTIRRYGMISLIWNFTKMAGAKPENSAADFILNK